MKKLILLLIVTLCCSILSLKGQERDSIHASVSVGGLFSTEDFNPFYLVHNRNGAVEDDQTLFIEGNAHYRKFLNNKWSIQGELGFRNDILYTSWLGISRANIELSFGLRPRVLGGFVNNPLSTGSLALGNNSRPVPQINLEVDYFNLPFFKERVKVKGGMSHGQLEKERYVSRPMLHQKFAKVFIDLDDLIGARVYSSLIHFAMYGGTTVVGDEQPSSFQDFLKVFTGRGIYNPLGGNIGEANALGNHLGITEWTWDQKINDYRLQINYQKPFEDAGSMQYLSFKDFLVGIRLQFPDRSMLKSIYFEWVRSMSQGGPGFPDPAGEIDTEEENYGYKFGGRDDYYNNWLYQSGWTFKNRIMSNPLFLTYDWALNFLPVFPNYQNQVINNRLNAFHIGALLEPTENLSLRTMLTYSINHGTYAGLYEGRFAWEGIKTDPSFDYVFLGGKNQFYSVVDVNYSTSIGEMPVNLKGLIAFDTGELYTNYGLELGVEFVLKSY